MFKTGIAMLFALTAIGGCKDKGTKEAADNTGRNDIHTTTADKAGGGADVDKTQSIRKAVMDDSGLSTNAHNVKIVVENGKVTLVGPVASVDEKAKIGKYAADVVGDANVTNQLEVAN